MPTNTWTDAECLAVAQFQVENPGLRVSELSRRYYHDQDISENAARCRFVDRLNEAKRRGLTAEALPESRPFPTQETAPIQEMPPRYGSPQGVPAPPEMVVPDWARQLPAQTGRLPVPASDAPAGDDFPRLAGDYLLISDTHVPYHDATLIERAITDALAVGIRRFVIIGDLVDGNQWSKRGLNMGYQRRWQDDVMLCEGVIRALLSAFESGVVLLGNHDAYFLKHFRNQADAEFLFARMYRTDDRVLWSGFEQAVVTSGGREIRLLHGANYSQMNALGMGQKLAAKYEQGIVMGHQHHAASGLSYSGRHQVVCLGGMYDPAKMRYVHESPKTNPVQTRSYGLLKEGYILHRIADGPTPF
jgi:predicted phosphodiesterase